MEVLAKTEYQDLYRVTDGVLLVVNKFIPIQYTNLDGDQRTERLYYRDVKEKSYNKGCQKSLKILKEDFYDKYEGIIIEEGTVTYNSVPVISTRNKNEWKYEIKTTGNLFSGNSEEIVILLKSILDVIVFGEIPYE